MAKRNLISLVFIITAFQGLSQQILYDFESPNLEQWQQKPTNSWEISSDQPLSGMYSLRHANNVPVASIDTISVQLPNWQINAGTVSWSMLVKHGYDPSSSNNWGVWLMADSVLRNGYVVGVNFTGSDDLLKLWKVQNGNSTIILTSTLNWQEIVKKTGICEIVVERKVDGRFNLKANPLGSTAGVTFSGSIASADVTAFSRFGVMYKYTSTARKLLWVDDIAISYQPVNQHDCTSYIHPPMEQVTASSISSLLVTEQQAVEVFRFAITDSATSDNLETIVKRITIKNTNASNWNKVIGGVLLKHESTPIQVLQVQISPTSIVLDVNPSEMIVPSGQTKEFSLWIYLKNQSLVDGQTLGFMVDNEHGFVSDLQGSGFAETISQPIESNTFTVDVEATKLSFTQQPTSISVSSPFSVEITATDLFGSIDVHYASEVQLQLAEGNGELSAESTLLKTSMNGIVQWNDLQYSSMDEFSILAQSNGLESVTSELISVGFDSTTVLDVLYEQPQAKDVQSVWVSPENAFEVLRLRIIDQGADGKPTYLKSLKLLRPSANYTALNKIIGGVLISCNGYFAPLSEVKITATNIEISFPPDLVSVPNSSDKVFSVMVYLRSGGLVDGDSLVLQIPQNNGFTTYDNGSAFPKIMSSSINSSTFTIDVEATKLSYTDLPKRVGLGQPFNVQVAATDIYQNVDYQFTGTVLLSKNLGNGVLNPVAQNSTSLESGVASFSGLSYSMPGVFNLIAQNAYLSNEISSNITCGDADANVLSIVNEVDTVTIVSTCTTPQIAVEVMRFCITDGGLTDNLPTIPTRLMLSTFNPNEVAELSTMIGGFVIETSTGQTIQTSFSVSGNRIVIDIPEYDLVIPNADSVDIILKLYLNPNSLTNSNIFRFFIPATSHGFTSSTSGTDFQSSLTSTIYGKPFKIKVEAVKLTLSSYPFIVTKDKPFVVVAYATDNAGNIDTDLNGTATISLPKRAGILKSIQETVSIVHGKALWSNLKINQIGEYELTVEATGLIGDVSKPLIVGYNDMVLIDEDFESALPLWNGISNWAQTEVNVIDGQKSLVHAGNASTTCNYLSFNLDIEQSGKAVEWSATIRNGNWDPTSSTLFYMILAASTDNFESAGCSGLAMGINPSTNNDYISLWSFSGTTRTQLITSSFDWNANDEVTMRATLLPNGIISLWYQPKGSTFMSFAGSAKISNFSNFNAGGFVYYYPESRIGQLWIDDVSVRLTEYPPQIESVKVINLTTLSLAFTKCVHGADVHNTQSYKVVSMGEEFEVKDVNCNGLCHEVLLQTDRLPLTPLTVYVEGVFDDDGNYITDSINYEFPTNCFGSIVINEIMANPANSIGLPEYEYIELMNTTSDSINVQGWRLQLKNTVVILPYAIIPPSSYAIICSNTASVYFAQYGQCIGVGSLPALSNNGMLIKLSNSQGNLVSFVNYSKSWYNDEEKANGGYSLERIDFANVAEESNNWLASVAPVGGTPCAVNSVYTSNPDITKPTASLKVVTDRSILITFSEPMDSLSLTYLANYFIDNNLSYPIYAKIQGDTYNQVLLEFSISIEDGTLYNMTISEEITDFSGNHIQNTSLHFIQPYLPMAGDVIINEVLFNPYQGGVDFVELYNRSQNVFDLSTMHLANRSTDGNIASINPASDSIHLLMPNSFAVITTSAKLVEQFYYVQNPDCFSQVAKMASYTAQRGNVILLNDSLVVIDELVYNEKMHNSLLNDVHGVSLERVNPDLPTNINTNWQSAAQTAGFATPTYKNSQFGNIQSANSTFYLSPETFSPDGDGNDDYLLINYTLPQSGYVANIRIFNASGVEVCRLANNAILGTEGSFRWDGQNSNNKRVANGIYVVHVEYRNTNGFVTNEKLVCVVAKR